MPAPVRRLTAHAGRNERARKQHPVPARTPPTPTEIPMNSKQVIAIVSTALALGAFGNAAHADNTANDSSFSGMWKMDYIDKDKDGMVSKAEFIQLMGKMWDMKAKEMKIKEDKMKAEDFKKFRDTLLLG
jgi:hypothetical protein